MASGTSRKGLAAAVIGGIVLVGGLGVGTLTLLGEEDAAPAESIVATSSIAASDDTVPDDPAAASELAPDPTVAETTEAPTTAVAETTSPTTVAPTTVAPTTVPPTTVTPTTVPPTTVPPTTAAAATTTQPPLPADVPESKATVRNGQIFLEGAVPDAETGERLAALAAEVIGEDNVFNNYVVDERAGDPSLGNITVEDTIKFDSDSAALQNDSDTLLNQGLALMTIRPDMTVTIVGHTDDVGDDEYNQTLSEQRAEAVKKWLTDRGIDADRIVTEGRGESDPIADNSTGEGRFLNRRIQFFLENLIG